MREYIKKLRNLYELKSIKTKQELKGRLESKAEQVYTKIIILDYLQTQKKTKYQQALFDILIIQDLNVLVPNQTYESLYEEYGDILGDEFPNQIETFEENKEVQTYIQTIQHIHDAAKNKEWENTKRHAQKIGITLNTDDFKKVLAIFEKAKTTYRSASQNERKESVAEHIYSTLLLAKIILETTEYELQKILVYKHILHHDNPELIVGDTDILEKTEDNWLDIRRKEFKGQIQIQKSLPTKYGYHTTYHYKEYHDLASEEAEFAKAIQSLDAEIHEMNYDEDWENYTEHKLRERKDEHFEDYPALQDIYEETITYQKEKGNL